MGTYVELAKHGSTVLVVWRQLSVQRRASHVRDLEFCANRGVPVRVGFKLLSACGLMQVLGDRSLDLHQAGLSGSLPDSMGALSSLVVLALNDNPALGGTLPVTMTALSMLQ